MRIPKHLAIIMDGNGRWAVSQGKPRTYGHEEGAERVREIVTACRELGVKVLTLYSFSTENWKRPPVEIRSLMTILKNYVTSERKLMIDKGIRLNAIGQIDRIPVFARLPLMAVMRDTRHNSDMILNLALSYGSRAEIVRAVRQLADKVASGALKSSSISEEAISQHLFTANFPDPDLLIRTSGESRLSNFLLWQAAYAELIVRPEAWPDFTRASLEDSFREFANRERRFGLTGEQLKEAKSC
ncbi:MAG: isoprenyl transferase [Myxococcota bacterium]|nr:isoprenyl transferase [Myxococcota bacterium]